MAGGIQVPWTQDAAEMLAEIGVAGISPILRDFDFRGKFTPFSHQIQIAATAACHHRLYILADLGVGKTAAAAWAAKYLLDIGRAKRVLIVCPLSIVELAWRDELFAIDMTRPVSILTGAKPKRLKALNEATVYKVINFDGIEILQPELLAWAPDLIIIDEARAYANPTTKRWKAMRNLVSKAQWCWALTGTPTPTGPMDAYGQVKLLTPDNVPSAMSVFKNMVMRQEGLYNWVPRDSAWEIVHKAMQPAIKTLKSDVLKDLPPLTHVYRHVPLSPQQRSYYEALRKEAAVTASGVTITAVHAAALATKLCQISSGCVYDENGAAFEFDVTPRITELKRVIEEANAAVLVFVPFVHTLKMLEPHLLPLGFKSIYGDVKNRKEIVDLLQAGKINGILAVPSTMSHGITATAASTIVWFAPFNKAEVVQQANNRMDRPGQKNAMTIVHLFGSPAERKVYKAVHEQAEGQANMLELFASILKGD
jgi:SNF2 family DNA or RNA helicase